MNFSERVITFLTRIFITIIVVVIVGIYYLSELRPFNYEGYENYVNRIQRYNAELNAAVVQTRFGDLKQYDPIAHALDGIHTDLKAIRQQLDKHPDPAINKKLTELETALQEKEILTDRFERINPVLTNAIAHFSSILEPIIESEQNNQLIEGCSVQDYRPLLIDKANNLFRGTLIYISQSSEERHQELVNLVNDIRTAPQKLPGIDQVLPFADKILLLQPELSYIDEKLLEFPIPSKINGLNEAYHHAAEQFFARAKMYHIILYGLAFLLLVVLRWAFSRLRGTVNILNIEVQRKIKAEKELEETNRQLEQRVADRTHELTVKNIDLNQALGDLKDAQDQLIMQEKMASVGMLTTGIAHEIKNPLNFVNNFSDISIELVGELFEEMEANKDKLAESTLKNIEDIISDLKMNCSKIKEHGVRADNIVKTMLLHSQETGVEKEMIDVSTLMNDNIQIALESFRSTHGKFEIKLDKNFDPKTEKVLAAPQTLGRAFIYMIDNSLYALREKQQKSGSDYQPILTISIHQQEQNVVIKVRDNGTGIPKKSLDKVFEPFFTTKPTGKGNTGLGLSICYDTVVKQHKGELRVTSEEGVFTEFTVVLPVGMKKAQN